MVKTSHSGGKKMAGEERIAVGEMVVRGATYSIILCTRR